MKQILKRYMPRHIRNKLQVIRNGLAAPLAEDANLHSYQLERDDSPNPRLSLVIPTIAADSAFGGVLTGIDLFLDMGRRAKVDLRVLLDDLSPGLDRSVLDKRARAHGIDAGAVEVVTRSRHVPNVQVRASDVFLTFNWWVTLNVRNLQRQQAALFNQALVPYMYIIQDYEPQFYPFSSTHMMARLALEGNVPFWGIFNTKQLSDYCEIQGHKPTRSFVFEPKISENLRPFLNLDGKSKRKRILIYGRPNIPRNCFSLICKGLSAWIEADERHAEWDIVSAGMPHSPIALTKGRTIKSLGKLSLENYAELLQEAAVGISLMSSPHPSYPPLEMAHFGLLTITNSYANKDLSVVHDNITSVTDIDPHSLSVSLKSACSRFSDNPEIGKAGRSHMPQFLRDEAFDFLDDAVSLLKAGAWGSV